MTKIIYDVASGSLSVGDQHFEGLWSGQPPCVNQPDAESLDNAGPLPRGDYELGEAFYHKVCGPVSMRLIPMAGTNTFGRDGFLVHGMLQEDLSRPIPERVSSHGCVIALRSVRELLASVPRPAVFSAV